MSDRNARKLARCHPCWISILRLLAPLLLHSPVNELHSIEIKEHTNSFFLLTQKIEGVKHNCSLTVSEVFPVGAASGGQAKSPSATGKSEAQELWATNRSRVELLQDDRWRASKAL